MAKMAKQITDKIIGAGIVLLIGVALTYHQLHLIKRRYKRAKKLKIIRTRRSKRPKMDV